MFRHQVAILVGLICAYFTSLLPAQDKYAVLIGVEAYNEEHLAQLDFTEDDALGLASSLNELGFNTKVMTGQSRSSTLKPNTPEKILRILATQMNSCAQGDTIIVSLSGHGLVFEGDEPLEDGSRETYFCPEDADPTNRETLLPISAVVELLKQCSASRKLLLIDACRNEFEQSQARKKAGRTIQLGSVHEVKRVIPGGMTVLFSCNENQVSWEHDELEHSVFTYYVLQYLQGNADEHYYDGPKLHLDGLTSFVSKRTNEYVFDNHLSADGQSPVRSGTSSDWVLGEGINPVKQLLAKHIEYLGGRNNLENVRTFLISGDVTYFQPQGEFTGTGLIQGQNKTAVHKYDVGGLKWTEATSPRFGWAINADGTQRYHSDDEHWGNQFLMRYPISAIDMLNQSDKFEMGPIETIDGVKTQTLIIHNESSDAWLKWSFADNGKLVAVEFPQISEVGSAAQFRLSKYRIIDGVRFPTLERAYNEGEMTMEMTFDSIQTNIQLDSSIFVAPTKLSSSQSGNGRTNDEIDQLIDVYNTQKDLLVEEWGGFFEDIEFSRTNQTTVRVEYSLANGIVEAMPQGSLEPEMFKPAYIGSALSADEITYIKNGLNVEIILKASGGSVVCHFMITANDF